MTDGPDREAPRTVAALSAAERDAALACLSAYDRIVLAVSGGSDSMALLHLVAGWVRDHRPPTAKVTVVTVNHCLRPEAGDEAEMVCRAALAYGLPHMTIGWPEGRTVKSNIQEAARAARYLLLAGIASATGSAHPAVVTAHTEDDQAETLLMRLARGSGLDGLAAMAALRPLENAPAVTLVRPLLGFSKARLVATLEAAGINWIEDPSNENPRFERVRLRAAHPVLAGLGFDNRRLALSARRLSRARAVLEVLARRAFDATVTLNGGLYALVDRETLGREPEEIRVRVLAQVVELFGGEAPAPQLSQIEDLVDRLGRTRSFGVTLGGAIVSVGPKAIRVCRELGRSGTLASLVFKPGERAIWDGRFEVSLVDCLETRALCAREPLTVRPFGTGAGATLKELGISRAGPLRAYWSLPAFWSGKAVMAVPFLSELVPQLAGPRADGHAVCTARFLGPECLTLAQHED